MISAHSHDIPKLAVTKNKQNKSGFSIVAGELHYGKICVRLPIGSNFLLIMMSLNEKTCLHSIVGQIVFYISMLVRMLNN